MRIRNRKVPLPLSSLSPIPLSDPQFIHSPVVQLQLHNNNPLQILPQQPHKSACFDPHQPSDQPNRPIGAANNSQECSHGAGPQQEKKVLLQEGKGGEREETSNDTRKTSYVSDGIHITVLQQSSSSHQGVGRWGEVEKAFPLKKRRGSFERRSMTDETITEKDKKMKTKMNKKCVEQNGGDNGEEEIKAQTKEITATTSSSSGVKMKARGSALLEGSRCSRVNGRGWRCCQQTLVGYSLCEHHLGKGRLRSMNSVRSRSNATAAAAKKNEPQALIIGNPTLSIKKEDTLGVSVNDHKVSSRTAYEDEVGDDDKEKPLMTTKKKMKLGMVKARSISSLLGQANSNVIGAAENNE